MSINVRQQDGLATWQDDRDGSFLKKMSDLGPAAEDRVLLDGHEFEDLVTLAGSALDRRAERIIELEEAITNLENHVKEARRLLGEFVTGETAVVVNTQEIKKFLDDTY